MREKEVFEKQRECDKRYIRRLKKPKVKKDRCYSESEIESEPEAYNNYGYDESERKTLPPKKKKRETDITYSMKKTMPKEKKMKKRMKAKARMTIERQKSKRNRINHLRTKKQKT